MQINHYWASNERWISICCARQCPIKLYSQTLHNGKNYHNLEFFHSDSSWGWSKALRIHLVTLIHTPTNDEFFLHFVLKRFNLHFYKWFFRQIWQDFQKFIIPVMLYTLTFLSTYSRVVYLSTYLKPGNFEKFSKDNSHETKLAQIRQIAPPKRAHAKCHWKATKFPGRFNKFNKKNYMWHT